MTVRRAAFDVGSGATKLSVCDFDVAAGRVVREVFGEERPVKLAVALARADDNRLSPAVCAELYGAMELLVRQARELGCAGQLPGIATAVFRKAANGPEVLAKLAAATDTTLSIITQTEEARLGFETAAALSDGLDVTTQDSGLVVWDSGGGSFQIVRGDPNKGMGYDESVFGDFAVAAATQLCVETVQGSDFLTQPSPNPVAVTEAEALRKLLGARLQQLPALEGGRSPKWLRETPMVLAIGSYNSIFHLAADILGTERFTAEMVKEALDMVVNCTDTELSEKWCARSLSDPPSFVVPKLCLLHAVMIALEIKCVLFRRAVGCCAGIMRSPQYYAPGFSR